MFRSIPTCFLITSPGDEFDQIRELVQEVCQELEVELISVDTASYTSSKTGDIADAIERADFVVVDLTKSDPNVFLEFGIAHALRKPILPISQNKDSTRSDFAGHRLVFYRQDDTEKLKYYLQEWVVEVAGPT